MNLLAIQICENDEEIKTLLVKHGKQTHLIPRIETNGPFRTHITWADGEYAYTVTQYHDYEVPEDNGYCAIRIPLAGATAQELAQVVRAFIEHGQDESGPYYAMEALDEVEAN